jgi:hypothetical protein
MRDQRVSTVIRRGLINQRYQQHDLDGRNQPPREEQQRVRQQGMADHGQQDRDARRPPHLAVPGSGAMR